MNYFPKIANWRLPADAWSQALAEMAIDGRNGDEGTAFWLGRRAKGAAEVSHVVFLRGNGIHKGPMNIRISAELMREVHERAETLGMILLGQIHSHASRCGVDMSVSDHAYGVSVPFFLSVVCPDFAQNPLTMPAGCGVHVFHAGKGYTRLSKKHVERKIILVPGLTVGTSFVGEKI